MRRLLEAWSRRRSYPLHLAALAIALTLPALGVGWQLDDHFQRLLMTKGSPILGLSAADIFSTLSGGPELIRRCREWGVLPWWTPDDYRLSFCRYLSILTHWIDYRLWPESAALMHAHSLIWFGALVAAAAALYRRIMGPGLAAGLAALLYAVDDAHAFPAAWIANRNALVATTFGLICLIAHDRWRRRGSRAAAWSSPIFLALALLSGEAATATAAWLLAYAVFLDRASPAGRLRALLPAGAVVVAWAAIYRHFGFGAHGSGLYVDPVADPLSYARAFADRAPFLLLGQWSPIPADAGAFLTGPIRGALWWAAVGLLAALGLALAPILRRSRVARFWCLGMILSLAPIAATFPSNRLLFFAGLGGMGLLAELLAGPEGRAARAAAGAGAEARAAQQPGRRIAMRALAAFLVGSHLILAPLLMPLGAWSVKRMGDPMRVAAASLPDDPGVARQDLVIVNAPDYLFFVGNMPTLELLEGGPVPRQLHALVTGPVAVRLDRPDARTLEARLDGGLFAGLLGRLFRDEGHPMAPGDEVRLAAFDAVVTSVTPGGQPDGIRFRFPVPLEDPSLRWLRWDGDRYVAFTPPAIGGSVTLAPARWPFESWPAMRE